MKMFSDVLPLTRFVSRIKDTCSTGLRWLGLLLLNATSPANRDMPDSDNKNQIKKPTKAEF